jgi:hypothetical protein
MSGQIHAPAAFIPGKNPRYPLDMTVGGSVWTLWGREYFFLQPGSEIRLPSRNPSIIRMIFLVFSSLSKYRDLSIFVLYSSSLLESFRIIIKWKGL